MIVEKTGNLLEQEHLDAILHQCNCFNVMGGGIAKQIAVLFPSAQEADNRTVKGDESKLGTFTTATSMFPSSQKPVTIINMYSQYGYGRAKCQTNYDAMKKVLKQIETIGSKNRWVIGIPKNMGCGLAGGDWNVVFKIVQEIFENSVVRLEIFEYQPEN